MKDAFGNRLKAGDQVRVISGWSDEIGRLGTVHQTAGAWASIEIETGGLHKPRQPPRSGPLSGPLHGPPLAHLGAHAGHAAPVAPAGAPRTALIEGTEAAERFISAYLDHHSDWERCVREVAKVIYPYPWNLTTRHKRSIDVAHELVSRILGDRPWR